MKIISYLLVVLIATYSFISCKKDTPASQLTFTNNVAVGTADASGNYTITGHITSSVRLDSVTLTKQGQAGPFLSDISTAKNKTDYTFSYLVTGITANTYILIDVYDQNGGKVESKFLINK